MNTPKTAVVAGHICLDVIPSLEHLSMGQFAQLFQPGHLISVGPAAFATGGPVSNTGLALHRLGIPTKLIAKVGADPFGTMVRQLIRDIDPALLAGIHSDKAETTSYSIIVSPPGADRYILHCPGVNDAFRAANVDDALVSQTDLFHFGYPPIMQQMYRHEGDELAAIFKNAKSHGATTSLDMALPDPLSEGGQADWQVILEKTLPYVDIFAPSLEEILFMLRRNQYETLQRDHEDILDAITPAILSSLGTDILAMGAKILLLKLGHRGAYLRTAGEDILKGLGRAQPEKVTNWAKREMWSPCFQVDVVGTTGAGDATIAGFLSAFLRGLSPTEAINAAVAVGACNVEAADALSGLRSWNNTLTRIQKGWQKHSTPLKTLDWHWNADNQLWGKEN